MKVGFVGLGSMGMGMARNLIKAGIRVYGFDISEAARRSLLQIGGQSVSSAELAARDADILLLMVTNGQQVESILFEQGVADVLPAGAVVILCSTILPSQAGRIGAKLANKNLLVIDGPVSGGKTGADAGTLSIMASGPNTAFEKAALVLNAISKKVYRLGDRPGVASTYKVVHQLVAGVHLAVMGEVMAFGVRAGCDPKTLYNIISNSAGQSWIFGDRVPYLLNEDYAPRSAIDIFVKDLSLVLETGEDLRFPLPLAATAQQLFLAASSAGYGKLNDAAIVKVYEDLTGVNVAKGISGRNAASR